MLVLSRKKGERIRIGKDIEVVVLEVRGNRVKLGFISPMNVNIRRVKEGSPEPPPPAESPVF